MKKQKKRPPPNFVRKVANKLTHAMRKNHDVGLNNLFSLLYLIKTLVEAVLVGLGKVKQGFWT